MLQNGNKRCPSFSLKNGAPNVITMELPTHVPMPFGEAVDMLVKMPDDRLAVVAAETAGVLKATNPSRWNTLLAVVDYIASGNGAVDPDALAAMKSLPVGLQAALEIAVLATRD